MSESGDARDERSSNPINSGPIKADLWLGVLGPMLITQGGTKIRALAAGQRAVLGLLALNHGSAVCRASIIDLLWGDEPPATAAGIVQTYISRLRSVLDPDRPSTRAHLPASDGAGYRLQASADELDLLEFRGMVDSARQACAVGDTDRARRAYEQALDLWRGEPLADIEALRWHPAVVGLADELATVVLEYADFAASLTGGQHDRVLPHLRVLAAQDPLHEASHARLMIALAGAGRQAEALREYEELRRRLDEQIGVLPGPTVREAYARILRQEIPVPARPVRPDAAGDRWTPVFQLPASPADFTGRVTDSERIIRVLTSDDGRPGVPLVAISGPPGVGKTTLALNVAHQVREQFQDGQLWVDLAGSSARPRRPGDVLGELLRALGVDGSAIPGEDTERAACFRSRLAGRRVLVLVDDAAAAAQVRLLTPGTADCALLVTSRARLEGLDGAHLVPLEMMNADDAADLLTRIVGQGRVAAEPEAAAELVQACGALPLALRIASAKLATRPSWPLSVMVDKITGAHSRLRELEAGDLSVRASIASSYESLSERSRRAFALLALLGPSDFAPWVAGALLGVPDDAPAADVIGELTDRSLLTPLGVDVTGEPRYRLHDLLRDYAAERLDQGPARDTNQALERLLAGWLQLARLADRRLPPEPYFPPPPQEPPPAVIPEQTAERLTADSLAWFTSERINLLTATAQACEIGRPDLGRKLASHQGAYQHLLSRYDDAAGMWRTIADSADQSDDAVAAIYARLHIGASMMRHGLAVDVFPLFDWCVQAAEQLDDHEITAVALYWRACSTWDLDEYQRAQGDAELGVRVAQKAGSRLAELMNLRVLGLALGMLGAGDRAVAATERALAIATELGVGTYECSALHNLAVTCTRAGQPARAITVCQRLIELGRQLGDLRAEAETYGLLGDAYHGMGDYETAVSCFLRALPVFREHRARRFHALCLLKLGYAYEAMGRYPEAIGNLTESSFIFRQLGLPRRVELAEQAIDRCRAPAAVPGSLT
jgi:DNA-binding SARP family transcriptional activator/DNA polymerase III delta prime subunit